MTRRGDIVILDVPYADRAGSKVRPALVVQADAYNQKLTQTVIAIITSSNRRMIGARTQLFIEVATPEGKRAGLKSDSVVQCNYLMTINQGRIHRRIGELSDTLMQRIGECLKESLAIP